MGPLTSTLWNLNKMGKCGVSEGSPYISLSHFHFREGLSIMGRAWPLEQDVDGSSWTLPLTCQLCGAGQVVKTFLHLSRSSANEMSAVSTQRLGIGLNAELNKGWSLQWVVVILCHHSGPLPVWFAPRVGSLQ